MGSSHKTTIVVASAATISNDASAANISSALPSKISNLSSSTINSNLDHNNANKAHSYTDNNNQNLWPEVNNMSDLFTLGCSTAVIFGGLVPYIPQYLKIYRTLNSEGFSTYVCLTLLLANIMRIMFWFGHRFELPLLLQSFVMIAGMLGMVEICVRVKDKDPIYGKPRRFFLFGKSASSESIPIYSVSSTPSSSTNLSSTLNQHQRLPSQRRPDAEVSSTNYHNASYREHRVDSTSLNVRYFKKAPSYKFIDSRDFWLWDDFLSYVKFLALFSSVFGLITYIFLEHELYIEFLGFLALFTESMLGVPQLLKNYSKRSTRGMSALMIAMWLSGDIFKTLYFILRHAPSQFWICGSVQVVIDVLILGQVLYYRKSYTLTEFA